MHVSRKGSGCSGISIKGWAPFFVAPFSLVGNMGSAPASVTLHEHICVPGQMISTRLDMQVAQ